MPQTAFERMPAPASAVEHALRGTEQRVFWLDDATPERHDALTGRIDTDLVVVGGGYAGLWTALLATERDPGARVTILEANRIGWAASGRNGGFCEASLTHGHDNGASRWPDEMDALERMGAENLSEIAATVERYGIRADLERTGVVKIATEEYQRRQLASARHDDRHVFLDGPELRTMIASPTYRAGLWDKDGNILVHPAKLAFELARVVADRGVRIFERSRVTEIRRTDRGVVAMSAAGAVHAERGVLATNVFPSLLRRNRLMTVPVYDYVLATEPLTAAQRTEIGWQDRQGLADIANQFHYYRQTADGRIVFGGYDAVYHAGGRVRERYEDRPSSFRRLAEHFLTTFPALEGIRFTHRWAGAIDSCSRFCAFYGTSHGGRVAHAAGFTGLGVAATRFAGNVMLDLLDGRTTERTALEMVRARPTPFPPEPAATIGINAVRWSMDRADHREGRRNLLLRTLDALGMGFDS
ncbi:FAD-binding oxidoreductase [Microbacterium sp. Au-Mic1]|uniref:NAD(P)/FAD-dependent oxidoreductase n=1 Tax=Microbacterium sp. Au-Mic1 TaxID=2906457 RepID=UPI001E4E21F0|nr:FAD-dependent oxidoreductase [Microbacterium sp. Au-Mic1]MCE4027282.1 FAD-binding oxidoreductase [Microbacterium sp. Au-Mic1]